MGLHRGFIMSSPIVFILMVTAVVFTDCEAGLQWAGLREGAVVYTCARERLALSWGYVLTDGYSLQKILWYDHAHALIATYANGTLQTEQQYAGHVTRTTHAGIAIDHVFSFEKGVFSVQVWIENRWHNETEIYNRTATVYVTDNLQTTDGHLHIRQHSAHNAQTNETDVVLECGIFTYVDRPPFDVTWVSPSRQPLMSSDYVNGNFQLVLPGPVQPGTYTCFVPLLSGCLHDNSGQATVDITTTPQPPRLAPRMLREARVEVTTPGPQDKVSLPEDQQQPVDIRIRDLERLVAALSEENVIARRELHALRTARHASDVRVQEALERAGFAVDKIQQLRATAEKSVSFHVQTSPQDRHLLPGMPLSPSRVIHNQGDAFDVTSGRFTAPFSGTYCFLWTTTPASSNHFSPVGLAAGGGGVEDEHTLPPTRHTQAGVSHVVIHLKAGQPVWLRLKGESFLPSTPLATFSGFLVSVDSP